jgi:hypothetical protein
VSGDEAGQADEAADRARAIAALAGHPSFRRAVVLSAQGSIELHRAGPLVGWILGDRPRALFCHRLLYLEATRRPDEPRSGILPSRVRGDCAELGLCSPGRATAMVALMQTGGYLAPGPEAADRRVRRLVPTARLWELQRERVGRQLAAIAEISPVARAAARHLGERSFEAALAVALNDYFVSGYRVLDFAPDLRLFAERSSGMLILFQLLLASAAADSYPLRAPLDMPIAELSRRVRVSRTHVLRLLREAGERGLLVRRGETIVPAPHLGPVLLRFFAALFAIFERAAARALAVIDAPVPA